MILNINPKYNIPQPEYRTIKYYGVEVSHFTGYVHVSLHKI